MGLGAHSGAFQDSKDAANPEQIQRRLHQADRPLEFSGKDVRCAVRHVISEYVTKKLSGERRKDLDGGGKVECSVR